MNKQITLGTFLAIFIPLITALIGWGVSVEVKLATYKVQIDQMIKLYELQASQINNINTKVEEIHTAVVQHEVKLSSKTNYIAKESDFVKIN